MCTELPFGLPQIVVSLLEDQRQKSGLKLKSKIIMDGDFTQVTLTWLPDTAGMDTKHVNCQVKKPSYVIPMRKKAPSEIRRDRARREEYEKKTYSYGHVKHGDSTANPPVTDVHFSSKQTVSLSPKVPSLPRITRARSKLLSVEELPRYSDYSQENSVFISPENCVHSSSFDSSDDPLFSKSLNLPVDHGQHETVSLTCYATDHASLTNTGPGNVLHTPEDTVNDCLGDTDSIIEDDAYDVQCEVNKTSNKSFSNKLAPDGMRMIMDALNELSTAINSCSNICA